MFIKNLNNKINREHDTTSNEHLENISSLIRFVSIILHIHDLHIIIDKYLYERQSEGYTHTHTHKHTHTRSS